MFKSILTAALAAALMSAPLAPALAQAKTEKPAAAATTTTPAPAKKLTAQQQKMKDCGAKWQEEKKAKGVKGKAAYQKFLSTCLKGSST
jgi:hypothetical protein